jgi:hypothetical protein
MMSALRKRLAPFQHHESAGQDPLSFRSFQQFAKKTRPSHPSLLVAARRASGQGNRISKQGQ